MKTCLKLKINFTNENRYAFLYRQRRDNQINFQSMRVQLRIKLVDVIRYLMLRIVDKGEASYSNFSMSGIISFGDVLGPYLLQQIPFLSTRNFEKFHLIALIKVPPCFFFKNTYSGCAFDPLTSILENMSKFTLYCLMKSLICSSVPGSCFPNWLHGKPRIRKPLSRYFASIALNCV